MKNQVFIISFVNRNVAFIIDFTILKLSCKGIIFFAYFYIFLLFFSIDRFNMPCYKKYKPDFGFLPRIHMSYFIFSRCLSLPFFRCLSLPKTPEKIIIQRLKKKFFSKTKICIKKSCTFAKF